MALPRQHDDTDEELSIPSFQLSAETNKLLEEFKARENGDPQSSLPKRHSPEQGRAVEQARPPRESMSPRIIRLPAPHNTNSPPPILLQNQKLPMPRIVRIRGPTLVALPRRTNLTGEVNVESLAKENEMAHGETLAGLGGASEKPAAYKPGPIPDEVFQSPRQPQDAPSSRQESETVDREGDSAVNEKTHAPIQLEKKRRKGATVVNQKEYLRLNCIGRGGSSRVYRVLRNDEIYALKRVDLRHADAEVVKGYKNEIDLLKKLSACKRIVNLVEWELNHERSMLNVVMEFGAVDFDNLLNRQVSDEDSKLDLPFVRHYWRELLLCVAEIHEHDIVHSDLKPANFVLVRDHLKLIDFGIANMINDDTVNVHRDHKAGTPNYMAPEALMDTELEVEEESTSSPSTRAVKTTTAKIVKIGKPSDIWSIGCILYKMIYGNTPFANIKGFLPKALAIVNPKHTIDYPRQGRGDVEIPSSLIRTMKRCLRRDQLQRPTAVELSDLSHPAFGPYEKIDDQIDVTTEDLGTMIDYVVQRCADGGPPADYEVWELTQRVFDNLKP